MIKDCSCSCRSNYVTNYVSSWARVIDINLSDVRLPVKISQVAHFIFSKVFFSTNVAQNCLLCKFGFFPIVCKSAQNCFRPIWTFRKRKQRIPFMKTRRASAAALFKFYRFERWKNMSACFIVYTKTLTCERKSSKVLFHVYTFKPLYCPINFLFH